MVNKIRLHLVHVIRVKTKKWEFPFGKLVLVLFAVFILNSFRVFGPSTEIAGSNEPTPGSSNNATVDVPQPRPILNQEIASIQ